ncbi:MAG: tetratricopeptide repeat protein [Terracidiphilus sp.]|nr:tetratricopeptide repeat protein [Terracidiphilus sp.]MDR3775488.1 tetratricopeptide repeat protein [Terracidiphilus sp.]
MRICWLFRFLPEAAVRTHGKQLVLAALFTGALVCGNAQTAADPALLSKASTGDAAAQVMVGEGYAAGNGQARTAKQLAEDYRQAAEWYRKAAAQGNIAGEMHLAALYRDGKGVARDMAQAAGWYRKAAEHGDATAQATLGVLYSMGQGVEHNDVEAYYWLDLAASVKGSNQEKYAANRQMIGTHITADELEAVQERVAQWKAAHPR